MSQMGSERKGVGEGNMGNRVERREMRKEIIQSFMSVWCGRDKQCQKMQCNARGAGEK